MKNGFARSSESSVPMMCRNKGRPLFLISAHLFRIIRLWSYWSLLEYCKKNQYLTGVNYLAVHYLLVRLYFEIV